MGREFITRYLMDTSYNPPFKRQITFPVTTTEDVTLYTPIIMVIGPKQHPDIIKYCTAQLIKCGWLPLANMPSIGDIEYLLNSRDELDSPPVESNAFQENQLDVARALYVVNYRNYQSMQMREIIKKANKADKLIFYMEDYDDAR